MSDSRSINIVEQTIVDLEQQWAAAIKLQDAGQMDRFLSEGYFLAIGVQDQPLHVVPRQAWLENLKAYVTHSFRVDDIQVRVHGDVAVVLMLATQHATVRGQERSAQFMLTDIWVKESAGWRVAERHSSRPEPPAVVRP
jgi:ketosteroid isomerase-like protein